MIRLTGKQAAGLSGAEAGRGKMAAAAVAEFQRAQSLLGTDRDASIDILHSIGKPLVEKNGYCSTRIMRLYSST